MAGAHCRATLERRDPVRPREALERLRRTRAPPTCRECGTAPSQRPREGRTSRQMLARRNSPGSSARGRVPPKGAHRVLPRDATRGAWRQPRSPRSREGVRVHLRSRSTAALPPPGGCGASSVEFSRVDLQRGPFEKRPRALSPALPLTTAVPAYLSVRGGRPAHMPCA